MLELYNDRLIDLLAPAGKDVSFNNKIQLHAMCRGNSFFAWENRSY